MNEISTYTLTIPSSQDRLFKSLAKEMGWIIEKPKKRQKTCSMNKAIEDIKKGRITTYKNVDDFFNKMNI